MMVVDKRGMLMVQSLNSQVEFVTRANLFGFGLGSKNGDILVGNEAFEFYNRRNPSDFVQIPWEVVTRVRVVLLFKRYIRGFFIDTKADGSFYFVCKEVKPTLRAIREHVGDERVVRNEPPLSWNKIKTWMGKRN